LNIEEINPDKSSPRNFSPALKVGDFIFVSGQASVDESGTIVRDGFEAEMRRSMSNVERILESAGLTLANVVQVRSYVDDARNLETYNRIYREYFTGTLPTRTTLSGCLGDVVSFEIDIIACTAASRPS
jgi:2-iminobutanoate/2-iminopropanoate deaminase